MWTSKNWQDYELLDCSDGERLERWGKYILIRPDPQVIWKNARHNALWKHADAEYNRSKSGGGSWSEKSELPSDWRLSYGALRFMVRPTGFKHTGIFPEQAVNWDWFSNLIRNEKREIKVLNLFAYTGGATVAAAKAGASVVHVDAAKGMVEQAKINAKLSGLENAPIRYIVDDCMKFIAREQRRGNTYDAIIMDPPSYGRGPSGETWKLEENLSDFVNEAMKLLSDDPLFVLINSYTTGLSPSTTSYVLDLALHSRYPQRIPRGSLTADEIGLPVTESGDVLPCGASARWEKSSGGK
ncbi:MAG: class I SAM-dependent methyltransferase [Eubacteriales bacterium]